MKINRLVLGLLLLVACNGASSARLIDAWRDIGSAPSDVTIHKDGGVAEQDASDALPEVSVPTMDASVEVSSPMVDASAEVAEVSNPLPDPCMDPNAASVSFPLKIMPAGDSITYGTDENGGYRRPLFLKFGEKAISVGTRDSVMFGGGPGFHSGYPASHTRGYSGYFQGYVTAVMPDIILLMLGTNGDGDGEEYVKILVRPTLDNNPKVKILVGAIPTSPTDNGAYATMFNTSLRAAILAVPEYGSRLFYVPETEFLLPTEFDPDNVHPNPLGYARIANAWYAKLSQIVCLKN